MDYNITTYSTALFSTWINVEELNLLIDAGDGVTAGLLQKSRKIKHVFITHADRDHLTGLPQFIQLNSREGFPVIHYPKDSGSFPAVQSFLEKFDPHVAGSQWVGIENGQIIPIKAGFEIEAIRNEHVKVDKGIHKSLSYKLYTTKKKLKDEFLGFSPEDIKAVIQKHGKDHITYTKKENIISFSGDTPIGDYSMWDNSGILIHEATFLRTEMSLPEDIRYSKHTTINEVLSMAKEINIEKLILTHFSTRYSKEEIDSTVKSLIKELGIKIPVYLVYPGKVKRNILATAPINS